MGAGAVNVLMVTDGLWNGGKERQLALLANSLPASWRVAVLSMDDGPHRATLENLGIEVHIVPRRHRRDVGAAVRMWRVAASFKPDVVHAWGWMSASAMLPFCRVHATPLVNGTIRLAYVSRQSTFGKLVLSASDAVVANSQAGLAAFGIAENERCRVVYNGFDPDRLQLIEKDDLDQRRDGKLVAIMAARMVKEKDWRLFVHAARVIAETDARWTFVAVGRGPEREALLTEAAGLISAGALQFPEGSLEVLPQVASADVGVLVTDPRYHAEGCSNSIMEYMACGLPVVCTDSGGNNELVLDGVTGLLVAPRDTDALVGALRAIGADRARAVRMGESGRRRLEERFSVAEMTNGYVNIYESLLGEQGGTES